MRKKAEAENRIKGLLANVMTMCDDGIHSLKEAVRAFERKPRNDVQKAETLSKA